MNTFPKLAAAIVLVFGLTGLSSVASAVHFSITDIINSSSGGFTSTVFHTSSGCGGTCGSIIETGIVGSGSGPEIGQYDPTTGDIFFGFDLIGGNSVSAAGSNLFFPSNPNLNDNSLLGSITYTFANVLKKNGNTLFGGQKVFTISYLDKKYGSIPNTLDDLGGGNFFMALWGSSAALKKDSQGNNTGYFELGGLGSDLRFEMTQPSGTDHTVIPLPAALPLYGTGLAVMGFIGWRKKRKAAVA